MLSRWRKIDVDRPARIFWPGRKHRVPLYRVHFKWKEKDVELTAKSLDLTHPYFVSIRDLVFPTEQKLVINPSEEEVRRVFGKADHLMIPFQTVSLIEELPENSEGKVMPFHLADADEKE